MHANFIKAMVTGNEDCDAKPSNGAHRGCCGHNWHSFDRNQTTNDTTTVEIERKRDVESPSADN